MIKIDFIQHKEITQSNQTWLSETAYDAKPEVLQPFWVLAWCNLVMDAFPGVFLPYLTGSNTDGNMSTIPRATK